MAPLSDWPLAVTGVAPTPLWQWTVAFGGTFLMLLPATVAMGATLSAMERMTVAALVSWRSLAPLYASNTVGAVKTLSGLKLVPDGILRFYTTDLN